MFWLSALYPGDDDTTSFDGDVLLLLLLLVVDAGPDVTLPEAVEPDIIGGDKSWLIWLLDPPEEEETASGKYILI